MFVFLRERLTFCPPGMLLAVGVSYTAFIMSGYDPSFPALLNALIRKGCRMSSDGFSAALDMILRFLSVMLFRWCIPSTDVRVLC